MRERYNERGPPLGLLLAFGLLATLVNLGVGAAMQVVVTHGSGVGLPSIGASTKFELIDAREPDESEDEDASVVPEALIFLIEPMDESRPDEAEYSAEFNSDVEDETRAQKAAEPGSARGTKNSPKQSGHPTRGETAPPKPAAAQGPTMQGSGGERETTKPGPEAKAKPPAPPDAGAFQEPGATPKRDSGPAPGPAPGATVQGSPALAPTPSSVAPSNESMRESMREVFGGGGSHQVIDGKANGPRDNVKTIRHDFAGFFVRIREQIVGHWDPNEAIKGESHAQRDAIHRRTRLTELRVRVRRDGSVDRIWIDRSSGFDILDEHAILAVRAGAPFANLPPGLQGEGDGKLVFSMQFRFTKNGGDVVRMRP